MLQKQLSLASATDIQDAQFEGCDIATEFELSKKTSITRKSVAAPLKRLIALNLIKGRSINFAKGREKESKDTEAIEKVTGRPCAEYDINWFNNPEALLSTYDSVYCGYCVNVLPKPARDVVWRQLSKLVKDDGVVYVSARTDRDVAKIKRGVPCFDGFRTSTNSFQKGFELFELERTSKEFFKYTEEIVTSSDFRLVRCSHNPLPKLS